MPLFVYLSFFTFYLLIENRTIFVILSFEYINSLHTHLFKCTIKVYHEHFLYILIYQLIIIIENKRNYLSINKLSARIQLWPLLLQLKIQNIIRERMIHSCFSINMHNLVNHLVDGNVDT